MGKSSSSSKKIKHSRDSSKLLRSVKKKKTKRNKSKKIKDYSDESESSSSDSSVYSSSEDDYRRKKRRSKVSKKRSRKRYSSSESDDSDDDDTHIVKKKQRPKRKDEHAGKKKKKISSRKRRKRRYSSSSSTSSESGSVRDNQSDDASESDENRRIRDRGKLGKAARRRSKDEPEEDSGPDECWQVEDEVMTENDSRRLKSIVVVSYTYDDDQRNEDMVDDNDDESDEEKVVDDEREHEATISYLTTGADEYGRKTVGCDEFEEDIKSETIKFSRTDNGLDDDLEAILKKRALENLKRFRGETQKSGIASNEVSFVSEGEPLHIEHEKVEKSQHCVSAGSKDLEPSLMILQDINVKESGTVLVDIASQHDQQFDDTANVKPSSVISSFSTKRKLTRPVLRQESLDVSSRKEAAGCQDAEAENNNDSTIDISFSGTSLALATKNGGENIEQTKVSSTSNAQSSSHANTGTLNEIKGRSQSEKKTMDETKDESQYEQKTMTVMRGGEMVQVSYKVYIPKKTSSLGRRQLKR